MARWTCPQCDREFARRQAHSCVPGSTVAESLARAQPWMQECYELIVRQVRQEGPVHEDAVRVGIFLKSDRKLAEFRPQARTVRLYLFLPEPVDHPRLINIEDRSAARVTHSFTLRSTDEIDEALLDLVRSAYDFATDN